MTPLMSGLACDPRPRAVKCAGVDWVCVVEAGAVVVAAARGGCPVGDDDDDEDDDDEVVMVAVVDSDAA